MTVHRFPNPNTSTMKHKLLNLEASFKQMLDDAKSLSPEEIFIFELGRAAQATQTLAHAMRDFIQQTEALDKAADIISLNIGEEK